MYFNAQFSDQSRLYSPMCPLFQSSWLAEHSCYMLSWTEDGPSCLWWW